MSPNTSSSPYPQLLHLDRINSGVALLHPGMSTGSAHWHVLVQPFMQQRQLGCNLEINHHAHSLIKLKLPTGFFLEVFVLEQLGKTPIPNLQFRQVRLVAQEQFRECRSATTAKARHEILG